MKTFLKILISLQVATALGILGFWDSEGVMTVLDRFLFFGWIVLNLPGIVAMLPLYLLGFGGIMHADALDGFEGYSMIIFPPTIVSVLFCVWIYRRLDKSKNADADAMPLDDKPKTQ